MGNLISVESIREKYDLPAFIETERDGKAGESAELQVWEAVKSAFAGRTCIAYWQYPIFISGRNHKLPDILIVDQELGLIIIEVKSFRISQIDAIQSFRWKLNRHHSEFEYPYKQASDQAQALLDQWRHEPCLKNLGARVLVALPNVYSEDWLNKGFGQFVEATPVLFEDNLSKASLLSTVRDASSIARHSRLSDESMEGLLRHLGQGKPVTNLDLNAYSGRGKVIKQVKQSLHQFDLKQEIISKQIPPGPQRIRGIAGSGKTVLLCQKAAQMHLKHPDWNIALVFFTNSLYDLMISSLDKWMRHFSNGELGYDAANSKLRVLHAWGRWKQPGFYSSLSRAHGLKPLTFNDIPKNLKLSPTDNYAYVLCEFLKTLKAQNKAVKPQFDAILVDEGQDLVFSNDLKFEEKQPFYWLAYQALRPARLAAEARSLFEAESDKQESAAQRRLIWAYDEAQSLDSLVVPRYKEIFGEAISQRLLSGGLSYPGNISKHEVMQRCYRTPEAILVAAHAIGMGLLRPEGVVSAVSTKEDWQKLGYEVEGDFRRLGSAIRLFRPTKNSPNPMAKAYGKGVLTFQTYKTRQTEVEVLAGLIESDLDEGLNPSRDLLIITLGSGNALRDRVANALLERGINYYIPVMPKANTSTCHWKEEQAAKFWCEDAVTISNVFRAKGNEADVVYILGFDAIAKREDQVAMRNQIFVALTRSRGFAHLSGMGGYPLYEEMKQVIRSGTTLKFNYSKGKRQLSDAE